MHYKQNHIVGEFSMDVEFHNAMENIFLPNHVANLVKDKLAGDMENLFNDVASNKTISIDKLEIDLGNVSSKNWEEILVSETIRHLRQRLSDVVGFTSPDAGYEVQYRNDEPQIQILPEFKKNIDLLVYFLQTGMLPWNCASLNMNEMVTSIINQAKNETNKNEQFHKLALAILQNERTLERFIQQFGQMAEKFIDLLVQSEAKNYYITVLNLLSPAILFPEKKKMIAILLSLKKFANKLISSKASALLKPISISKEEIKSVQNILQKSTVYSEDLVAAEINKILQESLPEIIKEKQPLQSKKEEPSQANQAYYISNAGLVILHPFLPRLFENIGYTIENIFTDKLQQRRALLFTQFLVTGQTEMPEHELLLNKIICGYPLQETLETIIGLTEAEQTEAGDLLQSVVTHWSALKATTGNGLRQSFLQREGKLTDMGEFWLLQVEQKSYDVLMQYLPWGISIIKLPWMEKRLMVEWA